MKILLIEDRPERKIQFSGIAGISSLDEYSFLNILTPTQLKELKNELKNGSQNMFVEFDLLMIHKSAFTQSELDKIRSISKPIVYFSGGIPHSSYTDSPAATLHVNSREFYSTNLIGFLETINKTGEIELMQLQFGEQWELNLLLNLREKLTQKINNESSNRIFAEDFDEIFTDQIMRFDWPETMANQIQKLKANGMASGETILSDIRNVVNEIINKRLNIIS